MMQGLGIHGDTRTRKIERVDLFSLLKPKNCGTWFSQITDGIRNEVNYDYR